MEEYPSFDFFSSSSMCDLNLEKGQARELCAESKEEDLDGDTQDV